MNDALLYESFELYPDSTFRWTSEYDLTFHQFGKYEISGDRLILRFYSSLSKEDLDKSAAELIREEIFLLEGLKIYRLNKKGMKNRRITDKSIRSPWSFLLGHKYRIRRLVPDE